MPIRVLAPEVANQIAAGEVVERPASAVKELIENSLDAGASDIRVEVREGGRRLIRVQDDGCGIPPDEVRMAFLRHATSKLSTTEDLGHLTTLGFRGEALASIASVAQVALLTRSQGSDAATLIRVAEGHEVEHSLVGAPGGTTVTVEHLFANVPARLKFLKQAATEAAHIQQVVTRYALAYPERRFSLVSDGKLLFQATGTGKLFDVLVKVYGLEFARQMIALSADGDADDGPAASLHDRGGPAVSGYVGAPALHRANRGYISLFVNRRWFQDSSIAYAVVQAYHTLLPVGRYPVAVVFLEMDPQDLDVNVHPTKAEVRFRQPNAVFAAVQRAVRRTLVDQAPIPTAGGSVTAVPQAWPQETPAVQVGGGWDARRDALLGAGHGRSEVQPSFALHAAGTPDAPPTASTGHDTPPERAPLLPMLRVVGQLAATYIVAEGPDGMYLIDQHAAHERVLYEQMLADHARRGVASQPLLEPLVLDLTADQVAVAAEELALLGEMGLVLEPFGGSSYLLRSVPAILAGSGQPERAVVEILDGLAQRDNVVDASHEARAITAICKRAAVKGNSPMSLPEMQELVRRLEACRSPRTCPHGRPTMVYMSAAELARQFGRI